MTLKSLYERVKSWTLAMASASAPVHPSKRGNLQKSHFQQTVSLADWWLVKAGDGIHGRGLAVAGYTVEGKPAMRVFSSAPILKRYDVFTVETTDGICVILNGLMNKERTLENGFPSDVFKYFVFGFPSYWKEYYENFVDAESSSNDISVKLLKNPSPHSRMEAGQTHVESHEKDFGSQGQMNDKGIQESDKTKSSAVSLNQTCGSVIGASEENLNMPWVASDGLGKESYSGGCSGEDHTTLELPAICSKNKINLLSDSGCEGNINVSVGTDKDVKCSQLNDDRGILSACHLYHERRKRATDDSRSVQSDINNSTKANFDRGMSLSEDLSYNGVGARIVSSLKLKQKNNQTSARITRSKISSISVPSTASGKVGSASDDRQPGSGNWTFEVSGLNMPANDEIQLKSLNAGSVKYGFDEVPETPNQDKGIRNIKTRSNTQEANNKATKPLHTPAAADNQTDKIVSGTNSSSKKVKAPTLETRRKLVYGSQGTPDSEEEKVPSASPLSYNRSRSGRLLMPTLEFWRNQIPIYDANRTITGIEEGILYEQPKVGSGSTSQRNTRKRKQPT